MSSEVTYIYLIAADNGRVKIGKADDVAERLKRIQAMSPTPLQLLWQTKARSQLESVLHQRFQQYRVHGEWFDFGEHNPVSLVEAAVCAWRAEPKPRPKPEPMVVASMKPARSATLGIRMTPAALDYITQWARDVAAQYGVPMKHVTAFLADGLIRALPEVEREIVAWLSED